MSKGIVLNNSLVADPGELQVLLSNTLQSDGRAPYLEKKRSEDTGAILPS